MKKKALLIILLSFSVLIIPPNSIMTFSPLDKSPEKTLTNEPKETIQINKYPDFPIPTNSIQKNTAESFLCQPNGLITPTYTEVSSSSKSILPENSSLNMTSHTTTSSQNVYTGTVDFLDLKINTLTNGSTVENYYSNRFAIHFSLTKTIISKGFLIGITPTIRETLLFSIREELNGPPILNGSLNEYIGNSAHDLLYPLPIIFDYTACSASELQLIKDNDYYLTLTPTSSTADNFLNMKLIENASNCVTFYDWINDDYRELESLAQFHIIEDEIVLNQGEIVSSDGRVTITISNLSVGNHALTAYYTGTSLFSESVGLIFQEIIPTEEIYTVTIPSLQSTYQEPLDLLSIIKNEENNSAIEGISVSYYLMEEGQSEWQFLGEANTNISGYAIYTYHNSLEPGKYSLKAQVNNLSWSITTLIINPKKLFWENIHFKGQYRNNPLFPETVKLSTTIRVIDSVNNPIENLDIELWYKGLEGFVRVPHYYQTNTTGYVTILYSVENCTVGTFIETHFFMPAPYETCYEGNSSLGNTMISKGELNVTFESMEVKWLNKVQLQTRVTSLGVGWGNIIADFYCFIDSQWIFLGSEITNETGYAILIWEQVNLTIGTYPIKVEIIESDYFQSKISFSNLKVERQSIEIYIIENGIMKGAGETIDVEYLSKMELVFFVKYGSDQPVVDKIIQIKGRLAGESYYTILGYITTNQSGYGVFVSYEELTLVGFAYSCIAEIQQTSFHEASLFHFKINLVKCTPYILLEEQSFERGTEIGLFALVVNAENTSLTGVSIIFTIGSESIQTITNAFGFAYVVFDTDLLVGEYQLTCDSLANPYFNAATNETMITITRGSLDITLYDSAALKSGYLTIEALILDSLGRPVPNISVNLSIVSWNEIVTSNQYGCITYTVKAANFGYGYHLLLLSFLGDAEWFETTVTARVLIYYEDVNLYFTDHSFTCIYNDQITVEVFLTTLTDAPLADRTLEFLAYFSNGTIITLGYGKTGVNGRLETSLLLAIKPGNYDLGVKYEGSVDYGPAISFAEVIVTKSAIQIIADDFEVIQNSLASYQLTIIDFLGKPVANLDISLYLWINNQWQYLTKATTNEFGVAVFSIACPSTLGIYDIKISFSGNLFYHENYQIQEMTVIEPPPKVEPIISANDYSIALYQNVSIQITISNYIPGTVVTLFVYINNNYTETIFIHDGLGHYQVVFTSIGLNNITFIAMEDAVYTSAVKTIFITVTPNPPPILQNFHYEEYVCEGEAFTFEASIIDASGIDIVLLILNGTNFHLQQETGSFFKITIPSLRAGYYHAEIFARDLQGNIIRESLPEHIEILEAKTQIIDYTPLNLIFEKGEIVSMEFFIYSETKIESITLYLNDTSYLLTKTYEITIHKTVWCFTSEKIPQGNYLLSIKISEQNSKDTTFTLQQSLIIIPSCPEIQNNQWRIITKGSQDIIQGNFTIFSFYEIQIVTVWLDGQQLSLHQISTRIYGFNASVPHAKTHELRIKIIDVNGRIFEETYKLGGIILNPNIKIFVIIVSVILLLLLIGGFVLIRKHIRKRNVENPPIISVPEIYDDMDSLEASSSSRDSTDQVPSVVQSSSSPVSQPSQNGNRLRQASERLSSSQQKNTEQNLKPKSERQQIDQQELAVFNVKEYIQKVEQEGLFDYIKEEGKPEKDSTNGDQDSDKESLPTTIDTMSSFSIDIDERLLPEKEQKKIHEQKRKDTASLSKDLRAITEEIEGTFKPK